MDKKSDSLQASFKRAIVLAFAYVGAIVGAGFASGQEVMQYFVSHGIWGIAGGVVVLVLFSITGLTLLQLGSKYKATSHEVVLKEITGPKLEKFIDYALLATQIIVGIVMIAGAGSTLAQQFGFSVWVGSLLVAVLIVFLGRYDTSKVVDIISIATPFLIVFVLITAGYSIYNATLTLPQAAELSYSAKNQATPFWPLSALNYVAFNIMMAASMVIVMGGSEKKPKVAGMGGIIGGIIIGLMAILIITALFFNVSYVKESDMPLLAVIDLISPVLGNIMSIILFVMIFNTALSLFYSFAARVVSKKPNKFNTALTLSVIVGFIVSFVGFKSLLSFFYPIIGYIGIVLIVVLGIAWFKNTRRRLRIARDDLNDLLFLDTKV